MIHNAHVIDYYACLYFDALAGCRYMAAAYHAHWHNMELLRAQGSIH